MKCGHICTWVLSDYNVVEVRTRTRSYTNLGNSTKNYQVAREVLAGAFFSFYCVHLNVFCSFFFFHQIAPANGTYQKEKFQDIQANKTKFTTPIRGEKYLPWIYHKYKQYTQGILTEQYRQVILSDYMSTSVIVFHALGYFQLLHIYIAVIIGKLLGASEPSWSLLSFIYTCYVKISQDHKHVMFLNYLIISCRAKGTGFNF